MPENTPVTSDQAATNNTPPAPTEPVATAVSVEPAPTKKSNSLLWMVVLAVVTLLAIGGAYLYTQGYFGTTTTTSSSTDSTDTAAIDAELTSANTEIATLEADLVQFESDGGSF